MEIGVAAAIALAFAGGWLAANFWANTHAPSFEILEDFRAEIPLLKFESFDGKILRGKFEGVSPRFLLDEKILTPKNGEFELDLEVLK